MNSVPLAKSAKAPARGAGSGGRLRNVPAAPPNMAPVVALDATVDPKESLDQQTSTLQLKLQRSVFEVVRKLQKKETVFNSGEFAFIRDGKAELQVWLTEKSDEAYAQLKELGFEIVLDAKNSKVIIGRLPVEKLEALAKLKAVKYVAPQK